jgi:hypothetical protein
MTTNVIVRFAVRLSMAVSSSSLSLPVQTTRYLELLATSGLPTLHSSSRRTFLEKMLVAQLVKFPHITNPKVYCGLHKSPQLDPPLSQMNPVLIPYTLYL